MHAPATLAATAVFGYSSTIASLSLLDGRACVRERGVTNRFDPLNEGELFTRFRPAMQYIVASLLAVEEGRAGNDSEVKHSCGPSVRPGDRCVFGSR